jgi:ferrous iron transport protein B
MILIISLGLVVGGGKALRSIVLLPLVNQGIVPLFERLITPLNLHPILHNILIGNYGMFRISFEWILALVVPYVILFQVQFALLEDSGVLPRIAVLFDNLMRKLGVQGGSLIHVFLGFGCAVPAIIGTRTATTQKERLMVTSMVCFAIPCISQTGALISLLSEYSMWLLLATTLTGVGVFVIVAKILGRVLKGSVDPLILEVPNLLIPEPRAYFKKLWIRIKQFLVEAEGPMLIAVFIAAILAETGVLKGLGELLKPVISGWLGLPESAVMSLILGIIRREMSVAPLLELSLTPLQMYVGAVVSLLYLPCLSVFGIIAKEFNAKIAMAITIGTTTTALFVGGMMNHLVLLAQRIF